MFSIYFLQPYGTTTVSPSNFTESNVARANERALKIVKKSTSAQHNVVSEARTDKANYDTTPISPRAPCPTLQGLLCYHPEGSASTARCNCSCAHSGQHQEEQRLTQAKAIKNKTNGNRNRNRTKQGNEPQQPRSAALHRRDLGVPRSFQHVHGDTAHNDIRTAWQPQ
jgi:hypothetical protein